MPKACPCRAASKLLPPALLRRYDSNSNNNYEQPAESSRRDNICLNEKRIMEIGIRNSKRNQPAENDRLSETLS